MVLINRVKLTNVADTIIFLFSFSVPAMEVALEPTVRISLKSYLSDIERNINSVEFFNVKNY